MAASINEFYNILCSVNKEPEAIWGKMSFQQMIEHLVLTVKISNGKLKVNCYSEPEKLPTLKKILMSERPFPRHFASPLYGETLPSLEFTTVKESLSQLKQEINDYINCFAQKPDTVFVNPHFGVLNKKEWEVFHNKHFRHHLSQFGLI